MGAQNAPGPWTVADNRSLNGAWWIMAKHPQGWDVSIAEVRNGCAEADEIGDAEANARLLAAAHLMMKTLECIGASAAALAASPHPLRDPVDTLAAIASKAHAAVAQALGSNGPLPGQDGIVQQPRKDQ